MATEESVDVRFQPGPASTNGSFVVDDDSCEDPDDSSSKQSGSTCEEFKQVRSQVSKETFLVKLGKSSVILSILIAGGIVSTLTYVTLNGALEKDARDAFVLFSQTIEDVFLFNVHEVFEASSAVGRAITTAAMTAGPVKENFPYVTVPAFESRAHEARVRAGFEVLTYAPVATNMQQWINFSTSNIAWYQESKEMFDQLEPGLNRLTEANLTSIPPVVYRLNNDGLGKPWEDNRLFCPSMYTSPPPLKSAKAIMNVDFFSNQEIMDLSLAAEKLKNAVFSPLNSEIGFLNDLMGGHVDRSVD